MRCPHCGSDGNWVSWYMCEECTRGEWMLDYPGAEIANDWQSDWNVNCLRFGKEHCIDVCKACGEAVS